jgi:GT2 family glycosyltransferase
MLACKVDLESPPPRTINIRQPGNVSMKIANPIDVSIIIVNWNTCELLRDCLRSLCTQRRADHCELIVVDNGSSDGSVEMVREEFGQVNLMASADNLGFAAANNLGMSMATGRYVLLLNSDTIVLDNAVEKTVAFADRYADTAVVGCRVLNPDLSLQNTCFMFPSILNLFLFSTYLYRLFPSSRFFGRERMTWWPRNDAREVDVVTGCYMLVRRAALDDVGPMDDQFFMYYEETDWCFRFKAKGWKNRFTPDAQIIHIGGASAGKLGAQRARIKSQSFIRFVSKHWSKPEAAVGILAFAFFYLVRLAVLLPKKLLVPNRQDEKLIESHWAGLKDVACYCRHYLWMKVNRRSDSSTSPAQ